MVPLPGARNIRTLSARFIADMQTHWEKNGMAALDEVRQKFPDRYVDNYVMLARVIRLEADVKHSMAKPKTVDEALAELESRVGTKGRRKFEKFLRQVAEDEDEDVFDVEFEIRRANFPQRWVGVTRPNTGRTCAGHPLSFGRSYVLGRVRPPSWTSWSGCGALALDSTRLRSARTK